MPAPSASSAATPSNGRRLVLLPVTGRSDEVVRRYRLACLRLESPAPRSEEGRFDHLKRSYD